MVLGRYLLVRYLNTKGKRNLQTTNDAYGTADSYNVDVVGYDLLSYQGF